MEKEDANRHLTSTVFRREKVPLKKQDHSRAYDVYSVVGLALLLAIVVLGSPIIGHLQAFWTFCGDCIQNVWNALIDRIGEEPSTHWFWPILLLQPAVYWLIGGLLTVADVTLSPSALRQYKCQPEAKESLATRRLVKVVLVTLFNQFVVGALTSYVLYVAMDWRGFPPIRELPSLVRVVTTLALLLLIEEVGLFYTHRLCHTRSIYRHFHKIHHEWKAPIAITALYQHPVEFFAFSQPLVIGIILTHAHPVIFWLVIVFGTLGVLRDHSGLLQPIGSPSHDYHHIIFNECYGVLGLMDRLYGTNTTFLSSGHGVRREQLTRAGVKEESKPLASNTNEE